MVMKPDFRKLWATLVAGTALVVLLGALWPSQTEANPPHMQLGPKEAVVWDIYGDFVVRGQKIHQSSLEIILATGLMDVTGCDDPNDAWAQLLAPDDIIALKFSPVASEVLATNQAVAAALIASLTQAGFSREQIMLVGFEEPPAVAAGTRPCPYGWQENLTDFGSDRDYLALWMQEATAIINVASLMDDGILGMRGVLANATLDAVKQPGRLYVNGVDPFLCDIYAHPVVGGKVRLHILNALRVLAWGGPMGQERYIYEYGSLLLSEDPVALDQVALHLLYRARRNVPLPKGVDESVKAPYLETAHAYGLGCNDLNQIVYHRRRP